MKAVTTILLLILSNTFMTFAWYGHLKFSEMKGFAKLSLPFIILISWGIALFEYCFQVPANRIGFQGNGGLFNAAISRCCVFHRGFDCWNLDGPGKSSNHHEQSSVGRGEWRCILEFPLFDASVLCEIADRDFPHLAAVR